MQKFKTVLLALIILGSMLLAQQLENPQVVEINNLPPDVSSIVRLVEIMSTYPSPEVVDAGISMLERIGPQEAQAVLTLVEFASHTDPIISAKAREKLLAGDNWVMAMRRLVLEGDYEHKQKIALLLGKRGEKETPLFLNLLRKSNPKDREIAIEGLSQIGPTVVFQILPWVEEEEPGSVIYQDVFKVLQNLGPGATTSLTLFLTHSRPSVRRISRESLIATGKDVIDPGLQVFYLNPTPELKAALQEVFYGIGPVSIPQILPLTTHSVALVRSLAEETIRKFGDLAYPVLLDTFTSSTSSKVKQEALLGLASLGVRKEEQVQRLLPLLQPLLAEKNPLQYEAVCVVRSMEGGSKEVVPELTKALQAQDWKLRREAAYALAKAGQLSDPGIKALMKRLEQEENGEVKIAICTALGNIGPSAQQATQQLIKCLRDEDEIVIKTAAEAIGKIGPGAKEAIPTMIEALNLVGSQEGKTIAWALAQMGEDAFKPLKDALRKGGYEGQRAGAALALGYMGPKARSAVKDLLRLLNDPVEIVKVNAVWAIGEMGDNSDNVVKSLIGLSDASEMVSEEVSKALGKMGKPAVRRISLEIVQAKNSRSKLCLIRALGEIGPDAAEALPQLVKMLRKEEMEVKKAVIETVGKMGKEAENVIPMLVDLLRTEPDPDFHDVLRQALLRFGEPAIPPLVPLLAEENERIKKSVIYIFTNLGDVAISHLKKEIRPDNNPTAIKNTMRILAESPKNTRLLIEPLTYENVEVHNEAVDLITRKIGSPAIPLLMSALFDCKSSEKRALIREPLVRMGAQAVPALIEVVETNSQKEFRTTAIETIAEIGPRAEGGVASLVAALSRSALDEQMRIIQCLGKIGPSAIPHLVKLLGHENETIRYAVIKALGETNSEEAVLHLLKTLENPKLLSLVVEALVGMKQIAVPILLSSLHHESAYVRFACAAAIFEIAPPHAVPYLQIQIELEQDPMVKYMLTTALKACRSSK